MMADNLVAEAKEARKRAYARYSGFSVGAALLGRSGVVYRGSNVENVSLGLTMCAERVCVGCAVQAGERDYEALAIVADSTEPPTPCGACRQVLYEFAPSLIIISATVSGVRQNCRLSQLLPLANQGILETLHVEHV